MPNRWHQEDCISMYTNNQGYWNDLNCGIEAGRICKRPDGETLPPAKTTVVPDGHCPVGWVHTGTKCVYFNKKRQNFTIARQVCQKMGSKADLASIHSAAEQAYLTAAMVTQELHMWIGMRYELGFYWVDQSAVTYMNWGPGEPNGGAGKVSASEYPDQPDHHTTKKCPAPHENYLAYNGQCYRAVTDAKTWELKKWAEQRQVLLLLVRGDGAASRDMEDNGNNQPSNVMQSRVKDRIMKHIWVTPTLLP
ncbi:Macrophage mannose receptor 1 [Portunus trituberculatus]|uniref:Macrophage mannose receptor 1 n=1 Tax=Portunus trituberculatus TaxID=210409 RepID=A0A5B7DLE8_PORTR|nr:Macrophage mannose receptor 1 [Portunus trituberculatus]